MKKEILILASVFTSVAFISCSKEKMESMQLKSTDEIVTISSSNGRTIDPLTVNLEGWFAFDGTLKDNTGKLQDAVPTSRLYSFGDDRKGRKKSAIYFDSTYGATIKLVPQQTNTSLSVWIKYKSQTQGSIGVISDFGDGPHLFQGENILSGIVESQPNGSSGDYSSPINTNWHHVVITYDGSHIKMYLDNVLQFSQSWPGTIAPQKVTYYLAKFWPNEYWKGYMDDLRFYSRTLTASDVQLLYNQ
jgi:hypothetical protein